MINKNDKIISKQKQTSSRTKEKMSTSTQKMKSDYINCNNIDLRINYEK